MNDLDHETVIPLLTREAPIFTMNQVTQTLVLVDDHKKCKSMAVIRVLAESAETVHITMHASFPST